jgi:hypothetical protein
LEKFGFNKNVVKLNENLIQNKIISFIKSFYLALLDTMHN